VADTPKIFMFYTEMPVPDSLTSKLSEAESVIFCVKTIRDAAVFTNKRILIADKQGLTGKKVEFFSLPYKSIVTYAIETAGTFDLDSEIKLNLNGGLHVEFKFIKGKEMDVLLHKAYETITKFVIG